MFCVVSLIYTQGEGREAGFLRNEGKVLVYLAAKKMSPNNGRVQRI